MSRRIIIATDGACSGNPGPGGWGTILILEDHGEVIKRKHISGGEPDTTNNRMEIMAAIKGLEALQTTRLPVTVISDSQYVVKGMTEWLPGWKARGWKASSGKPVENRDVWERLDGLAQSYDVSWQWVRGHNGHPLNEEADLLASSEAQRIAHMQMVDKPYLHV